MKSNYTHVSMLLDRSGSMDSIKPEVIGGFNHFIEDQKKQDGTMTVTLSQFDDYYENLYNAVDVKNVPALTEETFVPRGLTALLDSTGKLITDTGLALAALSEENRPEKVIFVILTDGGENASKEQTKQSISDLIKHQTERYNWQFIYIGAGQKAFAEADKIGVKGVRMGGHSGYSGLDATRTFSALSASTTNYRGASLKAKFKLDQEDVDAKP